MAWVALTKEEKEKVRSQLPDILSAQKKASVLIPDWIAAFFTHNTDSTIPQAAACLHDATRVLMQINHALSELLSFRIWYLERKNPPQKDVADYMSQFYADDIALRLHSVVEHLGSALNMMLEMDLKGGSNIRGRVKDWLVENRPNADITKTWSDLLGDSDWKTALKYRNAWVHNEPPIIQSWGIRFNRESRWKDTGKGVKTLTIGTKGDPPDWNNVEDLVATVNRAVVIVLQTTEVIIDFYEKEVLST